MTEEMLDLVRERPELGEPLPGADDYIGAEVVYAATHEGALHLEDVLARRTRISIEAWDRGVSAAPVAARLMAGVLGWDKAREAREVETYLERVGPSAPASCSRTTSPPTACGSRRRRSWTWMRRPRSAVGGVRPASATPGRIGS